MVSGFRNLTHKTSECLQNIQQRTREKSLLISFLKESIMLCKVSFSAKKAVIKYICRLNHLFSK